MAQKKDKNMTTRKPVVLVCMNNLIEMDGYPAHVVKNTYIDALVGICNAMPVLAPVIGADFTPADILDKVDGVLLTGSDTNLCPTRYDEALAFDAALLDRQRDETAMRLLAAALERDLPALSICRGMQEMNVLFGGSLHQAVHALPDKHDHRKNPTLSQRENLETQAHNVARQDGGLFERWGFPDVFGVNSLHGQGVKRLGRGLHVEAVSEDGVVEAISLPDKRFALGVQWHPEGKYDTHDVNRTILESFGKALRA